MIVILMGVTGSGKTLIGQMLADHIGATFADADDFHSATNKAKMAGGTPLTDEDRAPWLVALNGLLVGWFRNGASGVLACSALKASYRAVLAANMPNATLHFVLIDVPPELLRKRLAERHHEFMNASLLSSQIATLELPAEAIKIDNDRAPAAVVKEIAQDLGLGPS